MYQTTKSIRAFVSYSFLVLFFSFCVFGVGYTAPGLVLTARTLPCLHTRIKYRIRLVALYIVLTVALTTAFPHEATWQE